MTDAKFTVSSSPYADRGYDGVADETIELQLEDSPALDVFSCIYSVVAASADAPTLTLSNGGVADPPSAAVTFALPNSGLHSYLIRCQTNGGAAVVVAGAKDYTINSKERIVSMRSSEGLRKMVPGERQEYDPEQGWTAAQNEMVDALESLGRLFKVESIDAGSGYYVVGTLEVDDAVRTRIDVDWLVVRDDTEAIIATQHGVYLNGAGNEVSVVHYDGLVGEVAFSFGRPSAGLMTLRFSGGGGETPPLYSASARVRLLTATVPA